MRFRIVSLPFSAITLMQYRPDVSADVLGMKFLEGKAFAHQGA